MSKTAVKKVLALMLTLVMTTPVLNVWAEDDIEPQTLIDIDFSDYYDTTEGAQNVYTIAQLRDKGMKINGDNEDIRVAVSEDGIGEFYSIKTGVTTDDHKSGRIWFDALAGRKSGYFEFDVKYKAVNTNYSGDYAREATRKIFTLNNTYEYSNWGDDSGYVESANILVMNKKANTYGLGPGSGVNNNSKPIQTMIQKSGQAAKWCYMTNRGDLGGTNIYDLRIIVDSKSQTDDWTVNVYDKEVSLTAPITTWTAKRAEVADLTRLGMKWRGTKEGHSVVTQVLSWKTVYYPEEYFKQLKITACSLVEGEISTAVSGADITFNQELNPKTLNSIRFVGEDGKDVIVERKLDDSKKAVHITIPALTDGESYELIITPGLMSADGYACKGETYSFTASEAKNILVGVNFADYYDTAEGAENVYTIEQLREKGIKIQGDNDSIKVAITEDGIGKFYSDSSTQHQENRIWFDAFNGITSGSYEFDVTYKATNCTYIDNYAKYATRKIFTLNNKYSYNNWGLDEQEGAHTANILVFNKNASTYGIGPGSGTNSNDTPQAMLEGASYKWCYMTNRGDLGGTDIYNLKIVVESATAWEDWKVNVYDKDVSLTAPITVWTVKRSDATDLTRLGMKWRGTKSHNEVEIQVLSWIARQKAVKYPSIASDANPDSDIVLEFPADIANTALTGEEVILKTADGATIDSALALSEDKITVVPSEYLTYGTDYKLEIKDISDVEGTKYNLNMSFMTNSADLTVKSINTTGTGTKTTTAKLNNPDGKEKTVFVVSAFYVEENGGKVLGAIGAGQKTSQEKEITLTAEADVDGITVSEVKTTVFEIKDGVIKKLN